jgi:hypothetical protein
MNKRSFNLIYLAGLLVITFLFASCKKNLNNDVQPIPAAGLMAFNLIPDNGAVGFAISNNTLTNYPLLFGNYTGAYQGIYVGDRTVTSFNFNSGATLASAPQLFEDSAWYSVFALGANGNYRNVIVKDNLDSLPSTTGEAFVRYINAIPDSAAQPSVTISSNGTNVFNNNAAFATVSDFKGITPGNISVSINNGSAINASRTITVEKGKIYTILLAGMPGQSDTTKSVQIKFIQNGTVAATQ